MPDKVFFQCSLPRVGSTMFQNLMNQNPKMYASANNGLLDLLAAANQNYINGLEFKAQDPELMKKAFMGFCSGSIHGFYNGITDKQFALDKSRGHFGHYSLINSYYPDPKIICFVRNMPDIFASLEKMFRKNQHKYNRIVNNLAMQGITTPQRVDIWGRAFIENIERFANEVENGLDKKMLFIKYESFCRYPEKEMRRVYKFLDTSYFLHDFKHIEQTIQENEEVYEYTGLLKIRDRLEMKPSDAQEVLGKDVYDWIMTRYKWYNDYFGYS